MANTAQHPPGRAYTPASAPSAFALFASHVIFNPHFSYPFHDNYFLRAYQCATEMAGVHK